MIFELRTYLAVPGRLGDVRRRFEEATLRLFDKHGMTVIGMWDVLIGHNPELVYLLGFEDLASRQASWDAFSADPEWVESKRESVANGAILSATESVILRSVPFVNYPTPGRTAKG